MPKVSIIVPNFNHALYLPQRLDSILGQSYQDFEIILLDDCSTDNSKEIIEQYRINPKVTQIIYNEQNGGTSYKQWSKGVELAKGELIWIAESDDWCDNRFLEYLIPHFDDKGVVIVYSDSKFMHAGDKDVELLITSEYQKTQGIEYIRNQMLSGNKIFNASMAVFSKEAYLQVDGKKWKEMKLAGDWMLWVQIMRYGSVVHVLSQLNFCRRHDDNATGRFRKLGYDFLEGVEVLSEGKKMCKNKFNRMDVYLKWIDYYKLFKTDFDKGINAIVLKKILFNEPTLYFLIYYKFAKSQLKKIFLNTNH